MSEENFILQKRMEFQLRYQKMPQDLYVIKDIWDRLSNRLEWLVRKPKLFGMNVWVVEQPKEPIRLA